MGRWLGADADAWELAAGSPLLGLPLCFSALGEQAAEPAGNAAVKGVSRTQAGLFCGGPAPPRPPACQRGTAIPEISGGALPWD